MKTTLLYLAGARPDQPRGHRARLQPPPLRGFSLVEVTLAIGIIAFAFVALFGLLPTGMNTFRQAMDTSVGAQIAQRISGELQETDYYDLLKSCEPGLLNQKPSSTGPNGLLPVRYFDDQGNEVRVGDPKAVSPGERLKILYEVSVRISRAHQIPESQNGVTSRMDAGNLATVTIQVANNPSGRPLKFTSELLIDPSSGVPVFTYPAVIARNGSTPDPAPL